MFEFHPGNHHAVSLPQAVCCIIFPAEFKRGQKGTKRRPTVGTNRVIKTSCAAIACSVVEMSQSSRPLGYVPSHTNTRLFWTSCTRMPSAGLFRTSNPYSKKQISPQSGTEEEGTMTDSFCPWKTTHYCRAHTSSFPGIRCSSCPSRSGRFIALHVRRGDKVILGEAEAIAVPVSTC